MGILTPLMALATIALQDLPPTCYEKMGCFENSPPWTSVSRPVPPPQPPQNVCSQVIMFTSSARNVTITIFPEISLDIDTLFDPNLETIIICHGFRDTGYQDWLSEMADALLNQSDANVIIVDWQESAKSTNYPQSVSDIRVVAAEMELLVNHLIELGGDTSQFHLIGHSLGAHAMAYLAKRLPKKVGWLTGLDPAGPGFRGEPEAVRFAAGDANYTDVVHTNAGQYGIIAPVANVDYYMNGALVQPGCLLQNGTLEDLPLSCSHMQAHTFYISAIYNPDCFVGRPFSVQSFARGALASIALLTMKNISTTAEKVEDCNEVHCVPLGLNAINYPYSGSFTITTKLDPPYCLH